MEEDPDMTIGWKSTEVGGSPMRIYVAQPDGDGPHPAVVVAQHGGGVDEHIQDVVHRLHRQGYIAAAPELFHRQPASMERARRPGALVDSEILADIDATLAYVRTLPVAHVGITGFCMGGRVSYLAATSIRGFSAAAVFYGASLMKALGDGPSPFERSAGIECPILGCFGAEDANPSPADVKKIDEELTRLGKPHEFHSYLNAAHAFQDFSAPRYRERAARASWAEMLAFFAQHLKQAPR
jgi:carboxymethylenebutenolidase